MAFSMAGGGPSNPEINVTPLIDVLLVLIIIFMIVVTQQKRKGLDAQIPQPAKRTTRELSVDRTIVIQVVGGPADQMPGLKVNQEDVAWDGLEARLRTSSRCAPSGWRSCAVKTTWTSNTWPTRSTWRGRRE